MSRIFITSDYHYTEATLTEPEVIESSLSRLDLLLYNGIIIYIRELLRLSV